MRISTEWLGEYLRPVPPTAEAAELLTMAGYPVEDVAVVAGVDVMDVEVTSNRADLFSHVGVARELAALSGGAFTSPELTGAGAGALAGWEVFNDAGEACPYYSVRLVRGVKVGTSPAWMRSRLEAVGLRAISDVVDVTNYVLFELGQPLHAFDAAKLKGGRVGLRHAREGETLVTLDGVERRLLVTDLVIADAERAVALAGVMGGLETEVTADTRDVLLEAARFDPLHVRNTSRRLKLMSDSSFRFERGIDPTLPPRAALRAAALLAQVSGGADAGGVARSGSADAPVRVVDVAWPAFARTLGVDLPRDDVVWALGGLGFDVDASDTGVRVGVPSHRADVNIPVDVIEEAARVVGYDRIPEKETITVRVRPVDDARRADGVIRDALTACGLFEAVTFSFVADALRDAFTPTGRTLRRVDEGVRRADGHLRPSVLPGLLASLGVNETVGNADVGLFEIGATFWRDASGDHEVQRLAAAADRPYAEVRGVLEATLARLDPSRTVRVEPAEEAGYERGGCGRVFWGGEHVGHVGLCDAGVVKTLDLRHTPAMFELDYASLVAGLVATTAPATLDRFPAARRDVSLVVPDAVAFNDLADLVQLLALDDLRGLEHASTYRGKPLEPGQKSITLTLVFRRDDDTVPREHADAQTARLVEAATERLSATVRV